MVYKGADGFNSWLVYVAKPINKLRYLFNVFWFSQQATPTTCLTLISHCHRFAANEVLHQVRRPVLREAGQCWPLDQETSLRMDDLTPSSVLATLIINEWIVNFILDSCSSHDSRTLGRTNTTRIWRSTTLSMRKEMKTWVKKKNDSSKRILRLHN